MVVSFVEIHRRKKEHPEARPQNKSPYLGGKNRNRDCSFTDRREREKKKEPTFEKRKEKKIVKPNVISIQNP